MKYLGKFIAVWLFLAFVLSIKGFVFARLWMWFIAPTFQVQPLRVVEAAGLILLLNFVQTKRRNEVDKDKFWQNATAEVFSVLMLSGITLLCGWVLKLCL